MVNNESIKQPFFLLTINYYMTEQYDLIIVGAGIHGAAVAEQATEAGLSVFLLEQYSGPAMATSARSSKLIHGGLRYLETLSFGLVRECLLDRRRLINRYPDLVSMQKFYIPVYKETSRSRLMLRAGLSIYGVLGGLDKYSRYSTIPKRDWHKLDGIKQDNLLAVFQYWDGQTDDAKLTARLVEEAQSGGATVSYDSTLISVRHDSTEISVEFKTGDNLTKVTGKALINAAGPWVNRVLDKSSPLTAKLDIELVQGTHLELPGKLTQGVYYLESPQDRRAIFAMPWYDRILFGTTEKVFQGDPGNVSPSETEIDYLLTVYNHYFTDTQLHRGDVIGAWAGLRVLPASSDDPFARSRDTVFHIDAINTPKILSIYGGKLTSHHTTAKKALSKINGSPD